METLLYGRGGALKICRYFFVGVKIGSFGPTMLSGSSIVEISLQPNRDVYSIFIALRSGGDT